MSTATVAPVRSLTSKVAADSLWILAGYVVTAGAGFVFWIVAARVVPPERLGLDTAIFSAITAGAGIAASGIGNALLVFLPTVPGKRSLLHLAWATTAGIALITGLIAGILVHTLLRPTGNTVLTVAFTAAATMIWAFFVVKDPVLTALGSARSTLTVNGPVNLAKLGLLPVLALIGFVTWHPIVLSALIPGTIACALVYALIIPRLIAAQAEPTGDELSSSKPFFSFLARDGSANGLYLGLTMALPFLVTVLGGPTEGAVFAICYQVSLVLDLVVIAVGASLSTHAAGRDEESGGVALAVWLKVLALVTVGAMALVAASPLILRVLGPYYEASDGVMVIALLAVASVFRTSFEIWTSTLRARRMTGVVLVCAIAYVAALVPLVLILTPTAGAVGAATALLVVTVALSVAGAIGLVHRRKVAVPS